MPLEVTCHCQLGSPARQPSFIPLVQQINHQVNLQGASSHMPSRQQIPSSIATLIPSGQPSAIPRSCPSSSPSAKLSTVPSIVSSIFHPLNPRYSLVVEVTYNKYQQVLYFFCAFTTATPAATDVPVPHIV